MLKTKAAISLLLLLLAAPSASAVYADSRPFDNAVVAAEKYVRTELYFGLTKPDGSTLTESEWVAFVDEIITPRFPDGFTVVDGKGQWRNSAGKIVKESSRVFIVVYPRKTRADASKKIDEVRAEYKKRFNQESVMRIDITKSILVSF